MAMAKKKERMVAREITRASYPSYPLPHFQALAAPLVALAPLHGPHGTLLHACGAPLVAQPQSLELLALAHERCAPARVASRLERPALSLELGTAHDLPLTELLNSFALAPDGRPVDLLRCAFVL